MGRRQETFYLYVECFLIFHNSKLVLSCKKTHQYCSQTFISLRDCLKGPLTSIFLCFTKDTIQWVLIKKKSRVDSPSKVHISFFAISTYLVLVDIFRAMLARLKKSKSKKGLVIFSSQILYILKAVLTSEFNQLVPVGIFTFLFLRMLPKACFPYSFERHVVIQD